MNSLGSLIPIEGYPIGYILLLVSMLWNNLRKDQGRCLYGEASPFQAVLEHTKCMVHPLIQPIYCGRN